MSSIIRIIHANHRTRTARIFGGFLCESGLAAVLTLSKLKTPQNIYFDLMSSCPCRQLICAGSAFSTFRNTKCWLRRRRRRGGRIELKWRQCKQTNSIFYLNGMKPSLSCVRQREGVHGNDFVYFNNYLFIHSLARSHTHSLARSPTLHVVLQVLNKSFVFSSPLSQILSFVKFGVNREVCRRRHNNTQKERKRESKVLKI